jgi:bacterioferritin (cytochrome b1)
MTLENLIAILQEDLKNERKHMLFYLHSGVMVQGLHREELSELLLEEAKDEHQHVVEFSRLIVQLGAVPNQDVSSFPTDLVCPFQILQYARDMEQEVSDIYARRLVETGAETAWSYESYVHLFYEDQLQDSQKTALELNQYLLPYLNKETSKCPQITE